VKAVCFLNPLSLKKITTNDVRAILNNVYQRTQKRAWINQIRTYMHTLFSWGVKSDKSPLLDKPDIRFDILFNSVMPIPVLEAPAYVGERFLSFDELALPLKTKNDGYFNADVAVLIQLVFCCGGSAPMKLWGLKNGIMTNKTVYPLSHQQYQRLKMVLPAIM